jgi:hypothetical protein
MKKSKRLRIGRFNPFNRVKFYNVRPRECYFVSRKDTATLVNYFAELFSTNQIGVYNPCSGGWQRYPGWSFPPEIIGQRNGYVFQYTDEIPAPRFRNFHTMTPMTSMLLIIAPETEAITFVFIDVNSAETVHALFSLVFYAEGNLQLYTFRREIPGGVCVALSWGFIGVSFNMFYMEDHGGVIKMRVIPLGVENAWPGSVVGLRIWVPVATPWQHNWTCWYNVMPTA